MNQYKKGVIIQLLAVHVGEFPERVENICVRSKDGYQTFNRYQTAWAGWFCVCSCFGDIARM